MWTKNPAAEKASTLQHYLADPGGPPPGRVAEPRRVAGVVGASRTPGTGRSSSCSATGKLHAVVTQNVDGLHQQAGTDPDLVIEVHGTMRWTRCWECGDRRPMAETLERVARRRGRPAVPGVRRDPQERHDLVRPGARARGDRPGDATSASSATCCSPSARRCSVYPAASCVPLASGGRREVVIVNADPTDMDHLADAVLHGTDRRPSCRALVAGRHPMTDPDQVGRLFGMATFRDLLKAAKAEITEVDTAGAADRIAAGADRARRP